MAELTDAFNQQSCEELTGYTFSDVIAMYEDYEHMAKELEEIRNFGEYLRGWYQGQRDTAMSYRQWIPEEILPERCKEEILRVKRNEKRSVTKEAL